MVGYEIEERLKPPIAADALTCANGIDELLEWRSQQSRQLSGKAFIQGHVADQRLDIRNVLTSGRSVQPANELDGNQIFQAHDAHAIDDGGLLDRVLCVL